MIRDYEADRFVCSIDPLTLAGIGSLASSAFGAVGGTSALAAGALGAGGALAASSLAGGGGGAAQAAPSATPTPAPSQQSPVGQRGGSSDSRQPSFIGASSVPQQSGYGQKTLLGQ